MEEGKGGFPQCRGVGSAHFREVFGDITIEGERTSDVHKARSWPCSEAQKSYSHVPDL